MKYLKHEKGKCLIEQDISDNGIPSKDLSTAMLVNDDIVAKLNNITKNGYRLFFHTNTKHNLPILLQGNLKYKLYSR